LAQRFEVVAIGCGGMRGQASLGGEVAFEVLEPLQSLGSHGIVSFRSSVSPVRR
jgi:hypothetical protein